MHRETFTQIVRSCLITPARLISQCPPKPTEARGEYCFVARLACAGMTTQSIRLKGVDMGRYVLAWLLGVPATVLVLVYLILHR
jgi:hypothetical protein